MDALGCSPKEITHQIYESTTFNHVNDNLDWLIFIIIGSIMAFAIVLCILDFIHSKLRNGFYKCYGVNRSDTYYYFNIFLFVLAVCNLLTDIYVTYQMHCIMSLTAMCFIIITYLINIISMIKIYTMKCSNKGPDYWFAKYVVFFMFLDLISCDSYLTVSLMRSHIFGMDLFDSGHSSIELKKLWTIKRLMICIHNIPQMVLQVMFGIMIGDMNYILMLSLVLSFVLSVPFIFIWIIRYNMNYLSEWKPYYINVTLIPPINMNDGRVIINTDLAHETAQLRRYKGHKAILQKTLCQILGVTSSKIEIVYIDVNDGHKIHILHKVATIDRDITKLYDGKYGRLTDALKQIYHISLEWKILCELSGFDTETKDEDDIKFNILRQQTPVSIIEIEIGAVDVQPLNDHYEMNHACSMYNNVGSIGPLGLDDVNLSKRRFRMDTDASELFGVGDSTLY